MLPILTKDFEPVTYRIWRSLLRQLDDQLPRSPDAWAVEQSRYMPMFEVDETAEHYVMSFDLPGVHKNDLNTELTGNQLSISGERNSDGRAGSRSCRKFKQIFALPDGVTDDGIVADLKDGVLRLAIPKPAAVKSTKINITNGETQSREGGFFKSLINSKKAKRVEFNGTTSKPGELQ